MTNAIFIDEASAEFARQALQEWFNTSARVFPWRNDSNPYHVLIAEMMLRRTQARQVVPVYQRFIAKYPDIFSLNQAPENEVIEHLRPLGLSWRAMNFKHLALALVEKHEGIIPNDRQKLLSLPGVGPYVADAILCFSFNNMVALVDTNTVRVAARYFGFEYNQESRRRPAVIKAISHLIDQQLPYNANYAVLDFAATICKARDPDHSICPLAPHCSYYQKSQVEDPE